MSFVMRLILLLLGSALILMGCGLDVSESGNPEELADDYVTAINERDGERVCALMTADAAAELSTREWACA